MRATIVMLIALMISFAVPGQTKKECVKYRIRSITTYQTDLNKGDSVTWKESCEEFDRNGNTLLLVEYKKDGSIKRKESTEYNTMGDEIKFVEYDTLGQIARITRYTYTPFGEKSTEKVSDISGKIVKEAEYKYDSRGLKTGKVNYGKERELRSRKRYMYDYF